MRESDCPQRCELMCSESCDWGLEVVTGDCGPAVGSHTRRVVTGGIPAVGVGGLHGVGTADDRLALRCMLKVVAVLVLFTSACGGSDVADSALESQTNADSATAVGSGSSGGEGIQASDDTDDTDSGVSGSGSDSDLGVGGPVEDSDGTSAESGGALGEASPRADPDDGIAAAEHVADGVGSAADGYSGYVAPLTGLSSSDPAVERRRALAVKVGNNQSLSRPQAGLAEADVVFEVLIEGARTRFVAVHHSEIPARIGPVRSARSSDIGLMSDLGQPYFVSSGGNGTVLGQIRSAERKGVLVDGSANNKRSYFVRDKNRRAPYNLYFEYTEPADSESSVLSVPDEDGDRSVQAIFTYSSGDGTAGRVGSSADFDWLDTGSSGGSSEDRLVGIRVGYRGSRGASAVHIWDADLQGWVRIQDGTLHVVRTDSDTVEIAPANVLVLMTRYKRSAADSASPQVLSHGTGDAWLLTGGEVKEAVWERTEDRSGFRLTDGEGRNLTLTPGKTWVLFANQGPYYSVAEVETVSAAEGEQLLAEARSVFAGE